MANSKKQMKFFAFAGIFGGAAFVSAFQISSAAADKHHINWLWWALTFGFGILSLYSMYQAFQNSGGDSMQEK